MYFLENKIQKQKGFGRFCLTRRRRKKRTPTFTEKSNFDYVKNENEKQKYHDCIEKFHEIAVIAVVSCITSDGGSKHTEYATS